MGLEFDWVDGQTPLEEEEKEGLLIPTITTRGELDEFEQLNIERAIRWLLTRKITKEELLTEKFIKLVHKKMYDQVWTWAGEFRKTNKNLGVEWHHIPVQLRLLLNDCTYWIEHNTYPADELAVRFKHRIVSIHCFSNGNGRHSRMMGDLIIEKIFNRPAFTWGAHADITKATDIRKEYLIAIKAADAGDILPLLTFARK
jgi:Fic-DOC domain mobile mystery protein B